MLIGDSQAVAGERLRAAAFALAATCIMVAAALFVASGLSVDTSGALTVSLILIGLLGGAAIFRRRDPGSIVGDAFGAIGLIWLTGLACGAISLLVLRWQMPQADGWLLAADGALGLDALAITGWFADRPRIANAFRTLYGLSIPTLFIMIMVTAARGGRREVWSATVQFIGCLLTCCLIFGLMPAKGAFVGASPELIARLPNQAGTYAFAAFETFYRGTPAALGVGSIDGVVCFPSFHTACALISAWLCWQSRWLRIPGVIFAGLVILSTIPIGGHYVVDLPAGALIMLAWHRIARLIARSTRLTLPTPAPHPRAYA